jgi:alkanesulfonate monooxygenase SsuD/methylene tetrahydromethanopterin reductase-like flavin-dependent oxidoreductase (luciferase family)
LADRNPDVTPQQRMAQLLVEAELADQLGLDVFAIGEHHRPDYLVSSPAVVLAAIAARTERIRLSSAVTVLSSDDPVRATRSCGRGPCRIRCQCGLGSAAHPSP